MHYRILVWLSNGRDLVPECGICECQILSRYFRFPAGFHDANVYILPSTVSFMLNDHYSEVSVPITPVLQ